MRIAGPAGMKKANVALGRRLAVILHRMLLEFVQTLRMVISTPGLRQRSPVGPKPGG
jgi:hypothetical protein